MFAFPLLGWASPETIRQEPSNPALPTAPETINGLHEFGSSFCKYTSPRLIKLQIRLIKPQTLFWGRKGGW